MIAQPARRPSLNWSVEGRRVLVLAPHTDDAELGCGGSMAKFVEAGAELHIAAFSSSEESLPPGSNPSRLRTEFTQSATEVFGLDEDQISVFDFRVRRFSEVRQDVLEAIIELHRRLSPSLVLVPSRSDIHQDHEVVHNEAARAFKHVSMLCYEMPWNQRFSELSAFVQLSSSHVATKIAALERYQSQRELSRSYMAPSFIEGWARLRGVQAGTEFAEAFEVHKMFLA